MNQYYVASYMAACGLGDADQFKVVQDHFARSKETDDRWDVRLDVLIGRRSIRFPRAPRSI
jgi:hypothetical protein